MMSDMTDTGMATCCICGASNKERVYLKCIKDGEEKYVCVRCLPVLIHGGGH